MIHRRVSTKCSPGRLQGFFDFNGVPIREGSRLRLTETKPGSVEYSTMDGWGRTVPLYPPHLIPEKVLVSTGTVQYWSTRTGFVVRWEGYRASTGTPWTDLYMLRGSEGLKLEVIE